MVTNASLFDGAYLARLVAFGQGRKDNRMFERTNEREPAEIKRSGSHGAAISTQLLLRTDSLLWCRVAASRRSSAHV